MAEEEEKEEVSLSPQARPCSCFVSLPLSPSPSLSLSLLSRDRVLPLSDVLLPHLGGGGGGGGGDGGGDNEIEEGFVGPLWVVAYLPRSEDFSKYWPGLEPVIWAPRGIGNFRICLLKVYVAPSSIPGAGMGVYADEDMGTNAFFAMYGGAVIGDREAAALVEEDQDTHLLTAYKGKHIDGRPRGRLSMKAMIEQHLIGSLVNTSTKEECNAYFEGRDYPDGYQFMRGAECLLKNIYLRTSVNVRRGDELLVWYCKHYRHAGGA